MPAESSFSHLLSHCAAFPGKDAFLCSREMSDVMALEWRQQRTEPVGFCLKAPLPYLPSQGLVLEEFQKLSRSFFFGPCLLSPVRKR